MKPLLLAAVFALGSASAHADDTTPSAAGGHSYARRLAQEALARHPDAVSIAVLTRADGKQSTVGRFPAKPGTGPEVVVPLTDVSGDPIGELRVTYRGSGDHAASSRAIQHFFATHALHAKNLADPSPYDARRSDSTRAQVLVDQTMRAHPELLVFAIHATPPGEATNIIAGSNIGRIGKAADDDDLRVIDKGETNLEVAEGGKRFEVELPLNDASGKRIGALGEVFAFHPGEDKETLHRRAIAIRDALAAQIPTSAALFQPR